LACKGGFWGFGDGDSVLITFRQDECQNFDFIRSREWLVTNGIGGYASSTIAGMNTRRYHGLLVAATLPPLGRLVMLSQLEDTLVIGDGRHSLSTNLYRGNVVYPSGYMNLVEFRLDPNPIFAYGNGRWEVIKKIWMVHGQNTSVVEYTVNGLDRSDDSYLEIRPLIAFRDYHGTTHENEVLNRAVDQQEGVVAIQPYASLPKLYLAHDPAMVQADGYWYRSFEYEQERERGLDYNEDLFSPLMIRAPLHDQNKFGIIASTDKQSITALKDLQYAAARRDSLSHFNFRAEYGRSELIPTLYKAADQFIVTRAPFKTTIAGYHWFGDWGRDTMIALPGLLLATNQPSLAKEIFLQYVRYLDAGMLPNRFPDAGTRPEYNTVDATLWFFEAIRQYVHYRPDEAWRSEAVSLLRDTLYCPLKEIVHCHLNGTRYGIRADQDGFLWAGDSNTQLTWMDARVGDVAITPRFGRPVEIQALWHNALCTLAEFGSLLGDEQASKTYTGIAERLRINFMSVFWNPQRKCLFDVAGDGDIDESLRPNQIFAISLRYPLLSGEVARQMLTVVEAELLTPYGLRTLSSDDHHYRGTYQGDTGSRDSAYHQGTVWPWLAGAFFTSKLAVSESPDTVLDEIDRWLENFERHLHNAGVGQVSEIFDGNYPHCPRGCIAQAWSVAEILNLAKLAAKHPRRRR
jgi:predicted glycogen debranching enzyme